MSPAVLKSPCSIATVMDVASRTGTSSFFCASVLIPRKMNGTALIAVTIMLIGAGRINRVMHLRTIRKNSLSSKSRCSSRPVCSGTETAQVSY